MDVCPRCRCLMHRGATVGESSIYGSHDVGDLCEPCFFEEDEEIEREGTNNLPKTLEFYRRNMALGPL
jgi:hypothetical protein